MKKQLLTSILTIFFLSLDFIAFAQSSIGPSTEDELGQGHIEADDPVATPINGKILWLVVVGLAFAYYTYIKRNAVKVTE